MSTNTDAARPLDGVAEAELARVELYDTLAQLRDRLNYARRIDNRIDEAKQNIIRSKRENPVGFALGTAAAAATVGAVVWGIASVIIDRLSD